MAELGEELNTVGDGCVCMRGFYDTETRAVIMCYRGDYFPPAGVGLQRCTTCAELECVSECSGGGRVVAIKRGWSAAVQDDGAVSVLECQSKSGSGGCPGGETDAATTLTTVCKDGYEGLLCGSCGAGFTRNSDGSCTKCEDWNATGGIIVLVLMLVGLVLMMKISGWYGSMATVQAVAESINDLELAAIGKMLLATVQIITALPNVPSTSSCRTSSENYWTCYRSSSSISRSCLESAA